MIFQYVIVDVDSFVQNERVIVYFVVDNGRVRLIVGVVRILVLQSVVRGCVDCGSFVFLDFFSGEVK